MRQFCEYFSESKTFYLRESILNFVFLTLVSGLQFCFEISKPHLISTMHKYEIHNVTFRCPDNCIMSGNSRSRKTIGLFWFFKSKDVLCKAKLYEIYWFYSTLQNMYDEVKIKILVHHYIERVSCQGTLMSMIDSNLHSKGSLLFPTFPISLLFVNNLSKYSVPLFSSSRYFVCKCLFSLQGNMASFYNFSQHMRHNGWGLFWSPV